MSPDLVVFGGLSVHVTLKHLNLLLWCIGEPSKMGLPLPISLSVVNIWPLERRLSSLFFWMRLVYCLRITEEISLFPYFQQCVCVWRERLFCCLLSISNRPWKEKRTTGFVPSTGEEIFQRTRSKKKFSYLYAKDERMRYICCNDQWGLRQGSPKVVASLESMCPDWLLIRDDQAMDLPRLFPVFRWPCTTLLSGFSCFDYLFRQLFIDCFFFLSFVYLFF